MACAKRRARLCQSGERARADWRIAVRIVTLYTVRMIRSFRHKGMEAFFRTGKTSGIQAKHAAQLRLQLARLNVASGPHDMAASGWKLHPLRGRLAEHWAVAVSGNWRLTFTFKDGDAVLVEYQDYH